MFSRNSKGLLSLVPLIAAVAGISFPSTSNAQSIGYSDTHSYAITPQPSSYSFSLPGFDSSWGTLTSVTLSYSGSQHLTEQFENQANNAGPLNGHVFNAYYDSGMGLLMPGASAPASGFGSGSGIVLNTGSGSADVFTLNNAVWNDNSLWFASDALSSETHRIPGRNTYDGITDFGGTSGFTSSGDYLTVARSEVLTSASDLAFFTGSAVTLQGYSGTAFAHEIYGGNHEFEFTMSETATVSVMYTFTPVPEPSATLLLGLGGTLVAFRRKRSA